MRPHRATAVLLLSLGACVDAGPAPDSGDTVDPDDVDGDGFPTWRVTTDPEVADCDDHDPAVTPETERLVSGGIFLRGTDARFDAGPPREIQLSPYCIDRFEVRVEQYARGLEGVDDYRDWYDFDDDDDDVPPQLTLESDGSLSVLSPYERHPITEVWHHAADAWCRRAGKVLPTEAQWEKAARGGCELDGDPTCGVGDGRGWPWGEDPPTCALANFTKGPEVGQACVDDTEPVAPTPKASPATGSTTWPATRRSGSPTGTAPTTTRCPRASIPRGPTRAGHTTRRTPTASRPAAHAAEASPPRTSSCAPTCAFPSPWTPRATAWASAARAPWSSRVPAGLFDAHCHLDRCRDPRGALARARAAGVHAMLLAGVDRDGWDRQAALARGEDGLHLALGVHPETVAACEESAVDTMLAALDARLAAGGAVAVGETGLDHRRPYRHAADRQRAAMERQLRLARDYELPVVLHVVRAHEPALAILSAHAPLRGMVRARSPCWAAAARCGSPGPSPARCAGSPASGGRCASSPAPGCGRPGGRA